MSNKIEVTLIYSEKMQRLEAPPEFPSHAVYFHPLPAALQSDYRHGQTITGKYGKLYDSGKCDKRGKRIYVSYFIPSPERGL